MKLFPNETQRLRRLGGRLGISDERIIEEFRIFLDQSDYEGKEWDQCHYDFRDHLRDVKAKKSLQWQG
jgi:hypothetical protein